MEKIDQLTAIERLIPHLNRYRSSGGKLKMEIEDLQLLKRVYADIYRVNPNVGCPTCIIQYLNNLHDYYTREKTVYDQAHPVIETTEPATETKPCVKCGKKKSKV